MTAAVSLPSAIASTSVDSLVARLQRRITELEDENADLRELREKLGRAEKRLDEANEAIAELQAMNERAREEG